MTILILAASKTEVDINWKLFFHILFDTLRLQSAIDGLQLDFDRDNIPLLCVHVQYLWRADAVLFGGRIIDSDS